MRYECVEKRLDLHMGRSCLGGRCAAQAWCMGLQHCSAEPVALHVPAEAGLLWVGGMHTWPSSNGASSCTSGAHCATRSAQWPSKAQVVPKQHHVLAHFFCVHAAVAHPRACSCCGCGCEPTMHGMA